MDFKIKPWDHQLKAIEKSFCMPDMALLFEAGTGKTMTAINILRGRYAVNKRLMKTLILAPLVVLENWKREFAMHSKIDPKDIIVLNMNGPKRIKKFDEAVYDTTLLQWNKNKIILLNYDAILTKDLNKRIKAWEPEILICDESHRCKDFKSKRAIQVVELAEKAQHRYILTGTPILNTSMDIFNQYRILDGGETFGKNFYAFRAAYFEDANAGFSSKPGYFPKYLPKEHTYEELSQRIYRKGLRAVKSECLDLPPLVKTERFVEMSSEQTKAYKEMKDEYLTFVKDLEDRGEPRAVIANLAITKALRLQQIVSGFVKPEDGGIHRFKDVPRIKVLAELLEDLAEAGHKVIVWAVFKENYKMIRELCDGLNIKYTELHGEVPTGEKEANMDRFRSDPNCKVIVANQQSGGLGVNLVEAPYSVYYSKNFSLEQDIQSEARNYRGGSEMHTKVTRIDLVTQGSIDELVNESLRQKASIGEQILSWGDKL